MKKILIPTDFSIKSLNVIHNVVDLFEEPVEVVMFHAVQVPGGVSDLLFIGKRVTRDYITSDYSEACQVLRKKYSSSIASIKTIFFYGSTTFAFNNFVEANDVSCIIVQAEHDYKETYRHSINPLPLINKSKYKPVILKGSKPSREVSPARETLLELLVSA